MTDTEKVQDAITKIDYILEYKFITPPVRTELEAVKLQLQSVSGVS
jgi:hypothetical protein|tara:strand:+ start:679 stop:816 length:138 start_codon:yes stop_codon:yes gene_type:complete